MTNRLRTHASKYIRTTRLRMHYLEWEGAEPAVLLLHANQTVAQIWIRTVEASNLPNRFIALDHRGHGGSDYPAQGYTLDDYIADDVAMLDSLGLEQVVIVGLATGGNIGMLLASCYPERVRALVVANPGLTVTQETKAYMQSKLRNHFRFPSFWDAREAMFYTELWPPAVRDQYARELFQCLPTGEYEWRVSQDGILQTYASIEGIWDKIDVKCPTLLLRGPGSSVFTEEDAARLQALIPGSISVTIEHTSQLLNQDNPFEFARLLDEFVNREGTTADSLKRKNP